MTFKGWERVKIQLKNGDLVDGIAPCIISASRSTDIPAFYSKWFFERLDEGYVRWVNPFNGKPTHVSFCNVRVIAFWTKNPLPMIPFLGELDKRGIRYFFHYTLNDYEFDGFEKNVPPLMERIDSFLKLSQLIGRDRVLWRFDPLILTETIDSNLLLKKIENVGNHISKSTNRLTVSFLSMYQKVRRNFNNAGINVLPFDDERKKTIAKGLYELNKKWNISIVSCAENLNLDEFGIRHGSCLDQTMITSLTGFDSVIWKYLGLAEVPDLFNAVPGLKKMKDPGQRELCLCVPAKDIGMYNTCPHCCVYCYANNSNKIETLSSLMGER